MLAHHGSRRSTRRYASRIAIALLLGVATTITVALGLALTSRFTETLKPIDLVVTGPESVSMYHSSGPGIAAFESWFVNFRPGEGDGSGLERSLIPAWLRRELSAISAARWKRLDARGGDRDTLGISLWIDEFAGWPWPALRSEVECIESQIGILAMEVRGGVPGAHVPPRELSVSRPLVPSHRLFAVPYTPVWFGLTADTLLFATLWCLPLLGIPAARRLIRRHRGQCGACGYSLAGLPADASVCPECGAGIAVR